MSFRASIKEHYDRWIVQIKATPEPEGCEQVTCPLCGDAVIVRWARNSARSQVYHTLDRLWCEASGAAWYGATRAAAIENFQKETKGGDDPCAESTSSSLEKDSKSVASNAAPNVQPAGAATLQGWEFSADGLAEEEINKLLALHAETNL